MDKYVLNLRKNPNFLIQERDKPLSGTDALFSMFIPFKGIYNLVLDFNNRRLRLIPRGLKGVKPYIPSGPQHPTEDEYKLKYDSLWKERNPYSDLITYKFHSGGVDYDESLKSVANDLSLQIEDLERSHDRKYEYDQIKEIVKNRGRQTYDFGNGVVNSWIVPKQDILNGILWRMNKNHDNPLYLQELNNLYLYVHGAKWILE